MKCRSLNWDDWYIELYEDFAHERMEQLLKREDDVIREIGALKKQIVILESDVSDRVQMSP
jgi:hypothetical protein